MYSVATNLPDALAGLNRVLELYARYSRRGPEEIVRVKMGQLILGAGFGAARSPGLFRHLEASAPPRGRVSRERRAAGWRLGPQSSSMRWARERAAQLLGAEQTGAFQIRTSSAGGIDYISAVAVGKFFLAGKRAGQISFGTRSRRVARASGVSPAAARAAGGVVLNRQALAVALAIARRERSRLATAAQVLPSRFRTILRRQSGTDYRGGQAVGISSTDLTFTHRHDRALVQNRKGRTLGQLSLNATGERAAMHLQGNLGLHTAQQRAGLNSALAAVEADTAAYILARQAAGAAAILRQNRTTGNLARVS